MTHDAGATAARDPAVRDSEVALVPRTGAVRCVEARARALQGWRRRVWLERLRLQRYRPGGHYAHHFDWSSGRGGWGRVSSFMVWVGASPGPTGPADWERGGDQAGGEEGNGGKAEEEVLEGGGTEFPLLKARREGEWCRFVECDDGDGGGDDDDGLNGNSGEEKEEEKKGVVFLPRPGNAVYWENFRSDGTGRGYEETWHAGLPVKKGVKVGLNIWSWGWIE